MSYQYIDSSELLNNVLPKLSKASKIGLDLEFDRNSFGYGFVLCLIQISTEKEIFLIDPFAIEDLNPLWKVFEEESIVKVIHNASEDILLLKKNACNPKNIWDTEKAAMLLNHQKTGLSSLLEEYFDENLNKKAQRTNWRKRPLTQEQLDYAMEDVKLLLPLKSKLEEALIRAGRVEWILEEGQLLEELEQKPNETPFLRYKDVRRLDKEQKNRLRNFYDIRENWAEKMDKPPFQILSNDLLVKYSTSKIEKFKDWQSLKGLNPNLKDKQSFDTYSTRIDEKQKKSGTGKQKIKNRNSEMEKTLKHLRDKIKTDYGEQTAKLIISQSVINDILDEGSVDSVKDYAKKIILEYSDNIGLNIKN